MPSLLEELEKIAALRIIRAELVLDKKRRITFNVRLVAFDEYPKAVNQLADLDFLAAQFLDPNTGEKVFTAAKLRSFPKYLVVKLAKLWIDAQLDKLGETKEKEW